jgi:hypothetical protein
VMVTPAVKSKKTLIHTRFCLFITLNLKLYY